MDNSIGPAEVGGGLAAVIAMAVKLFKRFSPKGKSANLQTNVATVKTEISDVKTELGDVRKQVIGLSKQVNVMDGKLDLITKNIKVHFGD